MEKARRWPDELLPIDACIPGPDRIDKIRQLFCSDSAFLPFRQLPAVLLDFLISDTLCMPVQHATGEQSVETRLIFDESGEEISGYRLVTKILWDDYHPYRLKPFLAEAVWIPQQEGETFFSDAHSQATSLPFIRNNSGITEVLFIVHPRSRLLFQPLLEKHRDRVTHVPALALSSYRTLLVALPNSGAAATESPLYAMVKVSVDATVGNLRTLSRKDALSSVAADAAIRSIANDVADDLTIVSEPFAFVLPPNLLNAEIQAPKNAEGAGQIYRAIPKELFDEGGQRLIPFLSLKGISNRPLLQEMIRKSGLKPTEFVRNQLIKPLARIFSKFLYQKNISLEAHSQNLLLLLDADLQPRKFFYRDLGGLNCLLSPEQLEQLPGLLADTDAFYFANHFKDAADTLEEHWVGRVFFNLTKQFAKHDFGDEDFFSWKVEMEARGFLKNWSTSGEDDAHCDRFGINDFYRYGYFENAFAHALLSQLAADGIFDVVGEKWQDFIHGRETQPIFSNMDSLWIDTKIFHRIGTQGISEDFFRQMLPYESSHVCESPCIDRRWFYELVLLTYPAYTLATRPELHTQRALWKFS